MAEERKYYVLCGQNCKFESMTKEQILTAITQAVNEGTISDIDTGFVSTIKTINGKALRFFVGMQSEYEALTDAEKADVFALITNDRTKESLLEAINEIQTDIESLETNQITLFDFKNKIESGERSVPVADKALKDFSGRGFDYEYMRFTDRTHFTGNPRTGVEFTAHTRNGDGDAFIVSWEMPSCNTCFGLMWWDGETTTYSAIACNGYAVKFANNGYIGDGVNGLATIVKLDSYGNETPLPSEYNGTTLRLICVRARYVSE